MKILLLDIETSPIITYTWGLFDQNIALNQIKQDWNVIAWAAKWLDKKEIMYQDQRNAKNVHDDKALLRGIWALLDEADVVITQNGVKFDLRKLNARFVLNGMKRPSPYQSIDTLKLARKHFGFTSNKLEYMSEKLCKKYKKLKHKKFPGFVMWKECLAGNPDAWKAMEKYNKYDVLALEELYHVLSPWDSSVKLSDTTCNCGSHNVQKRGLTRTKLGQFQRYQCQDCGTWTRDGINLVKNTKNVKRGI